MRKQSPSSMDRVENRQGELQIGDQWNAINIIAQSQTHPLKAVCELVENAIDAGSTQILITRRRKEGNIYLEIVDDGKGIQRDDQGLPDFQRMATHICDSMKRHFEPSQRKGVHGEFGIGLLSFWSLGEQLQIASLSREGDLYEMTLTRGEPTYNVRRIVAPLFPDGTRVTVGPLLEATRSMVSGERLQKYLSVELRDRMKTSGVRIRLNDRVARKQIDVKPRIFAGDRLEEAKDVPTKFGDVKVELYLSDGPADSDARVAVCKDGTRVLADVCDLYPLDRAPWTESRLSGILDFEAFNLAPGTRSGIVPDDRLAMFLEAIEEIEPVVIDAIHARDRADSEKANRRMLQQLQRAFVDALQTLPENEYIFFDIPNPAKKAALASKKRPLIHMADCGLPVPRSVMEGHVEETIEHTEMPHTAGPMKNVTILPRNARVLPGESCKLRVIPRDKHGVSIRKEMKVRWKVVDGEGDIDEGKGLTCEVTSRREGEVTVEVTCSKGRRTRTDRVIVTFTNDAPDLFTGRPKGLPSYRCDPAKGVAWRSRYDVRRNEIVINSAHRDYMNSRGKPSKHRRYIGKLYAKEVVLMNFPHESPEGAMERLVEIMMRTEDAL
ncbi:MAG: ATP-binding protein [Pirellulaceae bacterium]